MIDTATAEGREKRIREITAPLFDKAKQRKWNSAWHTLINEWGYEPDANPIDDVAFPDYN